jgi:hypothetical protein
MKDSQFKQLRDIPSLVRKYQIRWEFVWTGRHTRTICAEYSLSENNRAIYRANGRVIQLWENP